MAESEFQEGNYDDKRKRKENFEKDMEKVVENMEKLTVQITWMNYDSIAMRTNPDLTKAMQHLEVVFLRCKEAMKKRHEELMKSRDEGQKKE